MWIDTMNIPYGPLLHPLTWLPLGWLGDRIRLSDALGHKTVLCHICTHVSRISAELLQPFNGCEAPYLCTEELGWPIESASYVSCMYIGMYIETAFCIPTPHTSATGHRLNRFPPTICAWVVRVGMYGTKAKRCFAVLHRQQWNIRKL